MAVYERSWRPYDAELTPLVLRFLVVTKFALRDVFKSRAFVAFYAACFIPTIVGLVIVYITHNVPLLEEVGLSFDVTESLTMAFFRNLFPYQAIPAFFVAIIVGSSLVAADLANNGLPMFLSRPISRVDYVLGKMAVLFILLSPATWIGGFSVWALNAYFEGGMWWFENIRIGFAYLVGHLTWIIVISLLSLAISVWVRFKPVAHSVLFGILFIGWGVAKIVNTITGSHIGNVVDIVTAAVTIVVKTFDPGALDGLPLWAAWTSMIGFSVFSLYLLWLKLRAHEVVS